MYRASDGLIVNEAMVLDGYAVAATFPPNVRFADRFVDFERQARDASRGLWDRCGGADTPITTTTTTAPPRARQAPPCLAGNCHPSYAGACVPFASDVDCARGSGNGPEYVSGPVRIVGGDPYGLDHDNDGMGCESG